MLELRNVSKQVGAETHFRDVSLKLKRGTLRNPRATVGPRGLGQRRQVEPGGGGAEVRRKAPETAGFRPLRPPRPTRRPATWLTREQSDYWLNQVAKVMTLHPIGA
jgi:hypothetical protein